MSDSLGWIVAHRAPLSMGFSKQEYWSGLPRPPPGDFPDPWMEPASLVFSSLAGGFFTIRATWEAHDLLKLVSKALVWFPSQPCLHLFPLYLKNSSLQVSTWLYPHIILFHDWNVSISVNFSETPFLINLPEIPFFPSIPNYSLICFIFTCTA